LTWFWLVGGGLRLFVVGSDGFVGTAICAKSRLKDSIVRVAHGSAESSVPLDLREPDNFDYSMLSGDCAVVFLAAISSPDFCSADPGNAGEINVKGTRAFIEKALARDCRVIFFSSDVVFGNCTGIVDEDTPKSPLGVYGEMKAEVETRFSGLANFKVVRPSYIVSVKDKFSSYLRGCALAQRTAEVFHPLLRSGIHIDDVIAAIDNLLLNWHRHPCPSVNLCGTRLVSRIDLAEILKRALGLELDVKVVEAPPGFYASRPPVIEMKSLHLESLLGRLPLDLEVALKGEIEWEQKK